jgi:hypothetical protein
MGVIMAQCLADLIIATAFVFIIHGLVTDGPTLINLWKKGRDK